MCAEYLEDVQIALHCRWMFCWLCIYSNWFLFYSKNKVRPNYMQVYEIMKEEGPRDRLGDRGSLQVQAAPRESVSHSRNSESYSTGGYSGDFVVTALVAFGQLDAYPFFCTCRFSLCLFHTCKLGMRRCTVQKWQILYTSLTMPSPRPRFC